MEDEIDKSRPTPLWMGPRTIRVPRTDNGFGFTLRHFIVYPPEVAVQEVLEEEEEEDAQDVVMQAGGHCKRSRLTALEPMDTIFVKQVKEGGPAYHAGLRRGDRIVSVNGEAVTGKTYAQVIQLIQASESVLKLLVVPKDEDVLQMAYETSAYSRLGEGSFHGPGSSLPEPPSLYPKGHPHRPSQQQQQRYKSELSMQPLASNGSYAPPLSAKSINMSGQQPPPLGQPGGGSLERLTAEPLTYGSQERLLRTLNERNSHRHSSDDLSSASSGSASSKRLPFATRPLYQPPPYSRSKTTSSLPSSASNVLSAMGTLFTSSHSDLTPASTAPPPISNNCAEVPARSARHSVPERGMVNLVTERMKKFESVDALPSRGEEARGRPLPVTTPQQKLGYDSVASRLSHFESKEDSPQRSSSTSSGGPPLPHFRPSSRERDSSASRLPFECRKLPPALPSSSETPPPPRDCLQHDPPLNTPPPIPPPSPLYTNRHRFSDSSAASSSTSCEDSVKRHSTARRQPSYLTAVNAISDAAGRKFPPSSSSSSSSSSHSMRHSSYNSTPLYYFDPPSRSQTLPTSVPSQLSSSYQNHRLHQYHHQPGFAFSYPPKKNADMPPNSCLITTATTSITTTTTVSLREPLTAEEKEIRVTRRTSYLMATGHNTKAAPIPEPITILSDDASSERLSQLDVTDAGGLNSSDHLQDQDPPPSPSLSESSNVGRKTSLDLPSDTGPGRGSRDSSRSPSETRARTLSFEISTPAKTSNIKKLKAFFGERTPRILEATEKKCVFDMPSPSGELPVQSMLNCKVAITDGKRASDRSWKPFWAVLRGSNLFLFKDKANVSPSVCEDQPISVKSCMVDIAYDYTKKKNVFRLTTVNGSEYLLQAEDTDTMMQWIKAIQVHTSDEESKDHASSTSLNESAVKSSSLEQVAKSSPLVAAGLKNAKNQGRSLRSKSPASHSPGTKPKQKVFEYSDPSSKPKDIGRWRGKKILKTFKRNLSSSSSADVAEVPEVTGTFGIALELCPVSSFSEYVPLVVEICTTIVEARGLESQGIYRVPGNTGSVTLLQNELDREGEAFDFENERWMDVNVVSSLLKSFFRKLPEPLITDEIYDAVISANRTEHPEKRMLKIKKLLHDLPEHNFETFRYLAHHLHKVAEFGHVNKMFCRNLAIVFGPTLIRPSDDSMVVMVKDMSDQCRIIESIISHHRWFFSSWDEDVNVPVDSDDESCLPVSGMNQQLLDQAENLEFGERGRDLSAKDLVSSIISAANKKIRKKDKSRSGDSNNPEIESEPPSYNERNIDREIELRRVKEMAKESSCSSISSYSSLQEVSKEVTRSGEKEVTRGVEASREVSRAGESTREVVRAVEVMREGSRESVQETRRESNTENRTSLHLEVKRYPAYPSTSDFYSFTTSNKSSSSDLSQQLRQLELDTQALRQKEEAGRLQQERHAQAKRQIELEMQRTRRELEQEDAHSVTSDYATMSTVASLDKPLPLHNLVVKSPMGRRYLTSSTATAMLQPHPVHDDIDLYRVKGGPKAKKGSLDSLLGIFDQSYESDGSGSLLHSIAAENSRFERLLFKQNGQEDQEDQQTYAERLRRGSGKMYNSCEQLDQSQEAAAQPSPTQKKKKQRQTPERAKRRHTLSGEDDLEHFKALMAVSSPPEGAAKPSAWERLQPGVKEPSRDMQQWCQQQQHLRHAGSSPALLDEDSPAASQKKRRPPSLAHSLSSPPSSHFTFESSI